MLNSVWWATARPLDALLAKNYNQTLKELKATSLNEEQWHLYVSWRST